MVRYINISSWGYYYKKILNHKNWHQNMYCDEYEVEIDDEDNLNKIFLILGLEEIALVDKKKKNIYLSE